MPQWWDVTEGIGGVGTALAFGGALWALWLQRRQLRQVQSQLDEQRTDKESAEARKVAAWVTDVEPLQTVGIYDQPAPPEQWRLDEPTHQLRVDVSNRGDEPIWDVAIIFQRSPDAEREFTEMDIIPPDTIASGVIDVTWQREWAPPVEDQPSSAGHLLVEVRFKDAMDRYWIRQPTGTLYRYPDDYHGLRPSVRWEPPMPAPAPPAWIPVRDRRRGHRDVHHL